MKIAISNHQKHRRPLRRKLERLVRWLMATARNNAAPANGWAEFHLFLTDDQGIRDLHEDWMAQPTATDVITVQYLALPGEDAGTRAEVAVNVQRAISEGPRHWRNRSRPVAECRELALYLAHACDHLHGADDATPTQRQRMRQRELRWLRRAADQGLLNNIMG